MKSLARIVSLAVVAAGALSCSDGNTGTGPDPEGPLDPPPLGLFVSDTARLGTATVAWVSARPGILPAATSVKVSNSARGSEVQAGIVNGGFDPVSLQAQVGDSLRIDVIEGGPSPAASYRAGVPGASPPQLIRTDPTRTQQDVPIAATFTMVFSEPMDSASLAAATTLSVNGGGVPTTLQQLHEGTSSVVTPASELREAATYQVQATLDARDRDGSGIMSAVISSFTTVADTRAPGLVIKAPANGELPAGYPCIRFVATDAGGVAAMDWTVEASPADGINLFSAHGDFGGQATLPADGSYCPDLPSSIAQWSATVSATDQAGNTATSAPTRFHLREPLESPVTVRSFTMVVYTSPSDLRQYAAPQVVLADAPGGSGFEVIGIEFDPLPGTAPFFKFVARNLEVPPGGELELFAPLYGDYAIGIGVDPAPAAGTAAQARVTWKDSAGQFHSSLLTGEFIAGGLPPYSGGQSHWDVMGQFHWNYEPASVRGSSIRIKAGPAR